MKAIIGIGLLGLCSLFSPVSGASSEAMGPNLCVEVSDPEGDALTVTFKGRLMDAPFQTIGVAGAGSDSRACVSWTGLETGKGYEWRVEVSDGTSTIEGPVWNFIVGCSTDAECDDGNDCTNDSCSESACSHGYAPTPSCCANSSHCDDGDPGTIDTCSGGGCSNAPEGGCTSNGDCNDGDSCTTDVCGSTGTANTAALSFNGSSQYIRTADTAPELGTANFTIEVWMKWDGTTGVGTSVGTGGLTSAIPLVTKGRGESEASNVDCNYFFGIDTATKKLAADFEEALGTCGGGTNPGAPCSYSCSTTTGTVCSIDSQCPATETCSTVNGCTGGGTCVGRAGLNHPIFGRTAFSTTPTAPWVAGWNHVAITYDGACFTLYVNGIDDTETTSPPIPAPRCPDVAPRSDNISPLGIATAFTSVGTAAGFFGGQLDEVRIWDFARSQADIVATKNQQVGSGVGLLGAWAFNEGSGATAADMAGINNEGSLTGGPAWITGIANLVDLGPTICVSTAIDCSDGDPCTLDVCINGSCAHPPGNDGASCDDGNVCTEGDACVGGACHGAPRPNGTGCDDGTPCTVNDQCSNAACVGTPASSCDDGSVCTTDSCLGAAVNQTALAFDGVDDYVTFGNAAELGLSQFTVETWFQRTGTGIVNTTGTGGIATMLPLVTKGAPESDGSNVDANYILGINTTGNVLAADFEDMGTGLNHPISGTTPIVSGTWYHAAATYDGTTWRLYLDGNLEATLVVGAFTPRFDSIQRAGLGAMLTSSGTRLGAFQGVLDEARIWSVARSQTDIQNGRLLQITSMTGLVARWGQNDGSGTTVADSTVPGTNGTITNVTNPAAAWVAGAPSLSTVLCSYADVPEGTTCSDGNACTTPDICGGAVCAGAYAPGSGCCTTTADCNDGNTATTDTCSSGTCSNTLPTTCVTSPDCNDNNACTADACVNGNVSSLNFDGTNDYVTMLSAAGETALGARAFTLEAWIKRDGASWGATTSTGTGGVTAVPLVTKGRGEAEGTNVDCNYFLGITAAGQLVADFEQYAAGGGWSAGQNHPGCGTATITDQGWHHVAVSYSTTAGWRFYVDGVEGTTADGTSCTTCNPAGSCPRNPGVEPRYDSIQHFGLGTAMTSTGATAGFFGGVMDEARVWNRALTLAEIQSGKSQELTTGTGLIGRWGLSENSGTTAGDATTPAQNGTLTNGPVWSPADKAPFGTCSRTPIAACCTTSAQCDDGNPCTTDSCNANACAHTNNTATCTDGSACTYGDVCAAGTCSGTAITCTSDACNTRTCNGTNTCTETPLSGNSCDDGSACTYGDVCTAGTCGGTAITCTSDACNTRTCNGTSTCAETPLSGNACDDGSACTYGDVCTAGACGGTAITCTSDACNTRTCNGTNTCTETPLSGNSCDDGSACTYGDVCTAGACGGTAITCTSDTCNTRTCNGTNACTETPLSGNACDDGSDCTYDDLCTAGACGGTAITCTSDACNTRTCNGTNTCTETPLSGNSCDDGIDCTSDDVCIAGTCGGTAITCTSDTCNTRTCNGTNVCTETPLSGNACDDGSACTYDDVCSAGTCAGTAITCTSDTCNTRTCNGTNACTATPLSGNACDDGSACTYDDVCVAGTCGGTAITCTSDACNTRTCNGTSTCTATPLSGNACDDGSACTYDDVCAAGVCGGTAITCTSDACNTRTCNGTNACTETPLSGNSCDDGSDCTYDDVCVAGTCGGTAITCTSDACNTRTCNGTNACTETPLSGNSCDDGSDCTYDDVCVAGTCGGTANAPPDGIQDSVRLAKTPTDTTITWKDPPGSYNVYKGVNEAAESWHYNHSCLANELPESSAEDMDKPAVGQFFYYVVSRVDRCGESSVGTNSAGEERPILDACMPPGSSAATPFALR